MANQMTPVEFKAYLSTKYDPEFVFGVLELFWSDFVKVNADDNGLEFGRRKAIDKLKTAGLNDAEEKFQSYWKDEVEFASAETPKNSWWLNATNAERITCVYQLLQPM